jgi:hypothetical protein
LSDPDGGWQPPPFPEQLAVRIGCTWAEKETVGPHPATHVPVPLQVPPVHTVPFDGKTHAPAASQAVAPH